MLATMLCRAATGETTGGVSWIDADLACIGEESLTDGISFLSDAALTCEQTATIMMRFDKLSKGIAQRATLWQESNKTAGSFGSPLFLQPPA